MTAEEKATLYRKRDDACVLTVNNAGVTTPAADTTAPASIPLQVTIPSGNNSGEWIQIPPHSVDVSQQRVVTSTISRADGSSFLWTILSNRATVATGDTTSASITPSVGNNPGTIVEATDGIRYVQIIQANVQYNVANYQAAMSRDGSLIDGGAVGGMAGGNVRPIEFSSEKSDVTGVANNKLKDLSIGTVAGLIETRGGPIIGIMHQYAYLGTGKTIILQINCAVGVLM